jgi:hypothetical protein
LKNWASAIEEVGLKLKNIQYMSSQPWPFPSNLMVAFRAEYESGEIKLQEEEIGFKRESRLKHGRLPSLGNLHNH